MAERLSSGNTGLALVANTIATGAILVVLITIFGPVSGAHFNPVVTLVMAPPGAALAPRRPLCRRPDPWRRRGRGPGQPHVRPAAALSETVRGGTGQLISETVATIALFGAIFGGLAVAPHAIPWLVGLTITAA